MQLQPIRTACSTITSAVCTCSHTLSSYTKNLPRCTCTCTLSVSLSLSLCLSPQEIMVWLACKIAIATCSEMMEHYSLHSVCTTLPRAHAFALPTATRRTHVTTSANSVHSLSLSLALHLFLVSISVSWSEVHPLDDDDDHRHLHLYRHRRRHHLRFLHRQGLRCCCHRCSQRPCCWMLRLIPPS